MAKRSCDFLAEESTEEVETPRRDVKKPIVSSVISESPVTSYHEAWGAPRKRVAHLCRIQTPASGDLYKEWSVAYRGVWGYSFNYSSHELYLYQLDEGELFCPRSTKASLGSMDWSALSIVGMNTLKINAVRKEDEEGVRSAEDRRTISSIVWETKNTASGRWFYRASRQRTRGDPSDEFVLGYFNREMGVSQTCLRIPLEGWVKMMEENAERIKGLFESSVSSRDVLLIKKTLEY